MEKLVSEGVQIMADKKFCPFINGECREDCTFYANGRECGLHQDIENLTVTLAQASGLI